MFSWIQLYLLATPSNPPKKIRTNPQNPRERPAVSLHRPGHCGKIRRNPSSGSVTDLPCLHHPNPAENHRAVWVLKSKDRILQRIKKLGSFFVGFTWVSGWFIFLHPENERRKESRWYSVNVLLGCPVGSWHQWLGSMGYFTYL